MKSINRTVYSSCSSKVLSLLSFFSYLCCPSFFSFLTARGDDCVRLIYARSLGKCLVLPIVFFLNFRGIANYIRSRLCACHIINFSIALLTLRRFSHRCYELDTVHLLVVFLLFLLCKVHWCGLLLHGRLWLLRERLLLHERLLLERYDNILIRIGCIFCLGDQCLLSIHPILDLFELFLHL